VFAAEAGGMLSAVGWTGSQGRTPRFIAMHPGGRYLYVANEQSDTIVAFRVEGGKLIPTGDTIPVASPVTIAFA
jgi:6-phosphogluconolactonase (cycloisomerase 2 family)